VARKPLKKFADGGSAQARYDRRVADIQSDYEKRAKSGNASVAAAKRDQRMADAKDDLAKRTGADRTKTRADESAAEAALTQARRTRGASYDTAQSIKRVTSDQPIASAKDLPTLTVKPSVEPSTFSAAFKAARADKGSGKTFMWRGKSYSKNMAGEGTRKTPVSMSNTGKSAADKAASALSSSLKSVIGEGPSKKSLGNSPGAPAAPAPAPAAKAAPLTQSQRYLKAAADEETSAAAKRKLEDPSNYSGSAILARLKRSVGFGSDADTRMAGTYRSLAQKVQDATTQSNIDKVSNVLGNVNRHAAIIAEGNKPGASTYAKSRAKFYSENPEAFSKGGSTKKKPAAKKAAPMKKYAKGGSIDGCAIRGKTRAKRTK